MGEVCNRKNPIENLTVQIISVLKKYQNEPLDGFFIAKIVVSKFENETLGIVYKNTLSKFSSAIIVDKLTDLQLLKVILIKFESNLSSIKKLDFEIENLYFQKTFSATELFNYLELSGDKNTIHFGNNAVVPGVLILQNFIQNCINVPDFFTIKFHNPLHLNQQLKVYKNTENEAVGIGESHLIFQIKLN